MSGVIHPVAAILCVSLMLLVPNVSAETIEAFTEPYREVELAAGDTGIISELLVEPGDAVKEGQLLLSLDNRVLTATLAAAQQKAGSQGNLDVARAELELRKERLAQIALLRQRGHATQRELSRAETDVAVAKARVQQAADEQAVSELDCKRIEAQISQRQIISPFSGIITEVHRRIGEPTLVTDPRIVTLSQLDRLRAKFSATPSQVAKLRESQTVSLILAESNKRVKGTIERISRTIDAKSGTLELHVVIDNVNDQIRSGARCLLEVTADHSFADNNSVTKNSTILTRTLEAGVLSSN